jgi:hypothetical protein
MSAIASMQSLLSDDLEGHLLLTITGIVTSTMSADPTSLRPLCNSSMIFGER